jgi:hypothetical protein
MRGKPYSSCGTCIHSLFCGSYWQYEIKRVSWLMSLLSTSGAGVTPGLSPEELTAIGSSSSHCCHEDGGKFCVLEQTVGMVSFKTSHSKIPRRLQLWLL